MARRRAASRGSCRPGPVCRPERHAPRAGSLGAWNAAAAAAGSPPRAAGSTIGQRGPGASSPPLAPRWPPAASYLVPTAGDRSWRCLASGLGVLARQELVRTDPATSSGILGRPVSCSTNSRGSVFHVKKKGREATCRTNHGEMTSAWRLNSKRRVCSTCLEAKARHCHENKIRL